MIAKKPMQDLSKGIRDDIEGEDDEESYYRLVGHYLFAIDLRFKLCGTFFLINPIYFSEKHTQK